MTDYEYTGEPVEIAERPSASRDVLRLTRVRHAGEAVARVDLRYWTLHADGSETPHRGGLRLTVDEARALRRALNDLDL